MKMQSAGIRKAAILASTLDQAAADAMLESLPAEQARLVRECMVDLDEIDPKERRRVIDEFRRGPMVPMKCPSGIELDDRLARTLSMSHRAAPVAGPAVPPLPDTRPFHFLHDAEGEKLLNLLADERPQTIALVLSHLPPEQAGNTLARLPGALQAEVVQRLIDLEETDPEVLRDVERALESRLSKRVHMQRRRVAGMGAIEGILKATSGQVGTRILDNLAAFDRPLADRLSPPRPTFHDLTRLDDATLGTIFQAADPALVLMALIGVSPGLIERILRRFPTAEAEMVRRQLDHPGPIRLSDLEEARQQLADLAHRLAMEGRIQLQQNLPLCA